MNDRRPTPEEFLERLKEEESSRLAGKLKIFLGMAPGVGKTYTMLESAQKLIRDGVDVVAGCIVTHGRIETEQLMHDIEVIPYKQIAYKDTVLPEFDLDAALLRKPQVVLVDELAHTNVLGSRHEKRWQDVIELINAGIDVYTTLNVQHVESANDIVAQITHVQVKETVPDSVLERANEIELVDLTPDELIQRLKEGKVYVPEHSERALENFFRKGNLIALRELALRATAERVDDQMQKYRRDEFIKEIWPATERILVCIGPHPLSARLVRATKRMAKGLHAEWTAAYVETARTARFSQKDRDRIMRTLRLAERLGAETTILTGEKTSEELVSYARKLNITKIVIGKPAKPRWREILFGSVVDDLIRKSGNIDVYVITGDTSNTEPLAKDMTRDSVNFMHYIYAIATVAAAAAVAKFGFHKLAQENLIMFFLLAVVITALKLGKGPSILCALLSVAVYDFFFIPPYLSFAVSDTQYLITFGVMLLVGLTLSTLTTTIKKQAELSRKRERHTATLYAMTRELASARGKENVARISVRHICEVFGCQAAVVLAKEEGDPVAVPDIDKGYELDAKEIGVAQWVFLNKQVAGVGTSTLPGARALYLPLTGSKGTIGVIGILPSNRARMFDPDEMHLLETFVNQMALAVERAWLGDQAAKRMYTIS
ncbi:MAG: sensor histidine kinase KdpD [Cyanobacteria bacterium SZAS-4]|nr:sensor histidine kinase KdpD [Cyanobacteria bacterium SZAS-4]